jgi:endonuclease YncB( thermonuclease family)
MPFTVIVGRFRVVGQTQAGKLSGFEPDGDSVQFLPDNPALLDRLPVLERPVDLTAVGSTQLRMEGMDALELHYSGTHQPRPLADQARDVLMDHLGLSPLTYQEPRLTKVVPPAVNDGQPGWIASRSLDIYGRPIAWVFAGAPPVADGAELFLDADQVRASANQAQLAAGAAYPLLYDTLFAELRAVMADAAVAAQANGVGLWAQDRTRAGIDGSSVPALEQGAVVWPKLYRRLVEFHGDQNGNQGRDLTEFGEWLATQKSEQVLDLDSDANFTHFDNLVAVDGEQVRLLRDPHRIVVLSAKGTLSR